jgi:RHS repeat-associated protein
VLVREQADGSQTFYVYGLGLIGEESAAGYLSYHFDLRGSTVALSGIDGGVVKQFQYSPYGGLVSESPALVDTPFLYNGRDGVMTDDTGLYYMRARYYNPEIRRFINQDPLLGFVADGQSLNRFAYVEGNPISRIDPFGLAYRQQRPLGIMDFINSGPFHHDRFIYSDSSLFGKDFGYYADGKVRSDNEIPTELLTKYKNVGYRDDGILKLAERRVTPLWNNSDYGLKCHNCQHFANAVDEEYFTILNSFNAYPTREVENTLFNDSYLPLLSRKVTFIQPQPFDVSPELNEIVEVSSEIIARRLLKAAITNKIEQLINGQVKPSNNKEEVAILAIQLGLKTKESIINTALIEKMNLYNEYANPFFSCD